jgi:hypothetical protein
VSQKDIIDPKLADFGTDRDKLFIHTANAMGSVRAAANKLSLHHSVLQRAIKAVEQRAALRGYAPEYDMTRPVPVGFSIKGTSTLIDKDGEIAAQWIKTRREDSEAEEVIRRFIEHLASGAKGKSPPIKAPKIANADLLAVYPMGDPHFGMLAIADECGDDFNLADAEAQTKAAFDRLVDGALPAETAIIAELGDFFHSDNESNRTSRSGAALDVSTRWSEVMQVGLRTMIYCIERTLTKHKKVIVRIVRGNHDDHSAFALSLALQAYFHNNPRVEVIVSASRFWYYEFGKVLLGLTHGDTTKMTDLAGIMSVDKREAWGRTLHRYWLQGHIHNRKTLEQYGCIAESFRTLAGKDAWHSGEGYRSGRDMHVIAYHREHGEIQRSRCDIGIILQDLAKKKAA